MLPSLQPDINLSERTILCTHIAVSDDRTELVFIFGQNNGVCIINDSNIADALLASLLESLCESLNIAWKKNTRSIFEPLNDVTTVSIANKKCASFAMSLAPDALHELAVFISEFIPRMRERLQGAPLEFWVEHIESFNGNIYTVLRNAGFGKTVDQLERDIAQLIVQRNGAKR